MSISTKSRTRPSSDRPTITSATRPTLARFEERRRRDRRRRIVQAAVAVMAVLVVGGTVWALWFSSWFTVTRVHVVGAHRVSAARVQAAAHVPFGRPMLRVDSAAIRRAVIHELPVLSSVTVTTQWPHLVVITVTERTPVAVVRVLGGDFLLMDRTGFVLGRASRRPDGMPLLSMDATSPRAALAAAATAAAALPSALAAKVSWVSATTPDSVVLQLKSGATVRWGDATQGGIKAKVLLALMKRQARVYDVSAPYAPTTARG